jgi:hypothetical protein
MKERPILFSAPMIRALLAGSKTQTRRAVANVDADGTVWRSRHRIAGVRPFTDAPPDILEWCPYGQPGDQLWVRECWAPNSGSAGGFLYRADHFSAASFSSIDLKTGICTHSTARWRPSINMPRIASRITLEVTGVRVERLQDISEADAVAEGIEPYTDFAPAGQHWRRYRDGGMNCYVDNPIASYASLWTEINGPGSWEANPWVWVVEFKRSETQEGAQQR